MPRIQHRNPKGVLKTSRDVLRISFGFRDAVWMQKKFFRQCLAKPIPGNLMLTLSSLIFANERRRPHSRIGKLEVFMEIVETVEEVPHVSSEYREYAVIAVLTNESYKMHAHLVEEFLFRHTEYLKRRYRRVLTVFRLTATFDVTRISL